MNTNIKEIREDVTTAADACEDQSTSDFLAQILDHWPEQKDTWSDGYHSFKELYDHRAVLFISLMKMQNLYYNQLGLIPPKLCQPYWSRHHHEGGDPMFDRMVIVGMNLGKSLSYHLREEWIPVLQKAGIQELDHAPKWDGHSPDDVVERMKAWCCEGND